MTKPQTETEPVKSAEQQFRESLQDVVIILKKLVPHCRTPEDLIGMIELAQINDGQLAILWEQVNPTAFRQ